MVIVVPVWLILYRLPGSLSEVRGKGKGKNGVEERQGGKLTTTSECLRGADGAGGIKQIIRNEYSAIHLLFAGVD